MPTLADKIFLPISIFVLNIVLAVFKFLLVSAVGACFTIYARCGGEYANSVRWIRSAGYLEMIHTFLSTNKRKNVPSSVKLALIVGLFATLVASILDKGIASFITPTFRSDPPRKIVVTSQQFNPNGQNGFLGWNIIVPSNGNVVDTMKKTLTSTIANPNQEPGQVYTPVISGYNTTCTDFGVSLEERILKEGSGCGSIHLALVEEKMTLGWFLYTERSPNRWSVMMGSRGKTTSGHLRMSARGCFFHEHFRDVSKNDATLGVTAFPRTATTKCFLNNGDVLVNALTTTRFVFPEYEAYSSFADTIIGDESDELFLTMRESIKNTTVDSPPRYLYGNVSVDVWMELRVSNSTVDFYACGLDDGWIKLDYPNSRMCIYATASTISFRQPPNNDTLQELEAIRKTANNDDIYMTLEYLTEIRNDGSFVPISIKKMRDDTAVVADYMAQLGSSYIADFNAGKLYIQYNVTVPKLGLEVPLWVLSLTGIIAVASLLLWTLTDWLIGSPYNSSLYLVIRDHLASVSNTPVPRLMQFRLQPLMFEDAKLLPDQVDSLPNGAQLLRDDVKSYESKS